MNLYYKKKFLLIIGESQAAHLIRKIKKEGGKVEYNDSTVTLKNLAALEVAKKEFWEL